MNKSGILFLNIIIFFFLAVAVFFTLILLIFYKDAAILGLIFLIPPLIMFILKKIATHYKWKSITIILSSIFIGIILFICSFLVEAGIIIGAEFWNTEPKTPIQSEYSSELKKLKRYYPNNELAHFPEEIPENAQNYYFFIENSFDGHDTHYLKFSENKNYINNVMKEYKPKCSIYTDSKNFDKYDVTIYTNEIRNTDKICILHKAASKDDERYTTGIAVNDTTNTIYYFIANYLY